MTERRGRRGDLVLPEQGPEREVDPRLRGHADRGPSLLIDYGHGNLLAAAGAQVDGGTEALFRANVEQLVHLALDKGCPGGNLWFGAASGNLRHGLGGQDLVRTRRKDHH